MSSITLRSLAAAVFYPPMDIPSDAQRALQLQALHSAALALTSQINLSAVLQAVVDESRKLVGARYGALGVLNDAGDAIEYFITSGISAEQRAHIGTLPRGKGLLGAIIKDARPIRVDDMGEDARAAGFHAQHPVMHSLLGVPIVARGRVYGNLYLTDKVDIAGRTLGPFTDEDQETLQLFAMQAAIAIENARLHRKSEELAIAQEREQFAMDLHDGIIQSIYAVGLTLDDARYNLEGDRDLVRQRIDRAIAELDEVITDLRRYILRLTPARLKEHTLVTGLEEIARDARARSFLTVFVNAPLAAGARATPEQTSELLHIAREALSNALRHAQATEIRFSISADDTLLTLSIGDDGIGFAPAEAAEAGGHGLQNMGRRARRLGGHLAVESALGAGTTLTITVPLTSTPASTNPVHSP